MNGDTRIARWGATSWASTLAIAALISLLVALIAYQGTRPGSRSNARTERLERLGSQTGETIGDVHRLPGDQTVLGTKSAKTAGAATWAMPNADFARVLPRARNCKMSVYVGGLNISSAGRGGSVRVDLNNEPIGSIGFDGLSPEFPTEYKRLAPVNVRPTDLPVTPLFSTHAIVFPINASNCKLETWTIRIAVRGAEWKVERVGILAHFTPRLPSFGTGSFIVIGFAFALVLVMLAATYVLFNEIERAYGKLALFLVLGIFVCALLTHDEWDFPVWLRFVDLAALGHANPALMWGGLPLWPIGTAAFAPILSTVYVLTGNGSQEVSALFIKLAMALAMCTNALVLASLAKLPLRRFFFPIILLAPAALYELAGGYRELFAGSFFIAGASLALRQRFTLATIAFAAATSISESVAFAILLPAALRLASGRIDLPSIGRAAGDIALGLSVLAFELIVLEPHGVVANTVSARLTEPYRLGGGSWLATIDGFGILPPWISDHSAPFTLLLLAILALPPALLIIVDLRSIHADEATLRARVFGGFLALIAAFFLAYHGVDPSTWYTIWIATTYYFMRFEPLSPFPIFLSVMQAFAFYAILGIQDFANATYVAPTNHALLGVLGRPMLIGVLAVNLTIAALYISRLARVSLPLFGRGSFEFAMLFFFAAGAAAIKAYPIDIVFCIAAGIALLGAFRRLTHLAEARSNCSRQASIDYIGLIATLVIGVWGGTHNPAAGLVAFVALLLGIAYGFGMCDVVLAVGGTLLVATQYGFGWVSIGGYIGLSLLAIASLRVARTAATLRSV